MKTITEEFKEKLKDKIQSFEKSTSIELVPVIAARSNTYFWPRLSYSLFYSVVLFFVVQYYLHLPLFWQMGLFLGLSVLLFALFSWAPVLRFVLPSGLLQHEVEESALDAFCIEEVFATKARTGVLVFVSLLEHKVFVLADKGLSAHVSKEKWQEMGQKLAADFSAHNPGQSFFSALDMLVQEVAVHFPPCSDNPNELPNSLRIK